MSTAIEMGTISSRGQIAIPSNIRNLMGLEDGTKILFFAENDTIMLKKVTQETFAAITKPLKAAIKNSGLKEKDVVDIVHKARKK
ncbi:AbrB/MazE/SpoVT family DNA-binding domain-containing protein [Candidatus Woesearchaeota archaeon]|nr:AbrB/MazE/SpoVT family DNA-binding domain-containing protein [Candidatus Woesearchaeota archaeon]